MQHSVSGYTTHQRQNLWDPGPEPSAPRLPVLSGDLGPHKLLQVQSEMHTECVGPVIKSLSSMLVGEEVKCAEGGITMIHTGITGSSRILFAPPPLSWQNCIYGSSERRYYQERKPLKCPKQPVFRFRHLSLPEYCFLQQYPGVGLPLFSASMRFCSSEKCWHLSAPLSGFQEEFQVPREVLLSTPAQSHPETSDAWEFLRLEWNCPVTSSNAKHWKWWGCKLLQGSTD